MNNFRNTVLSVNRSYSRRVGLEILQANVGNRCNQRCSHCHMDAGPGGDRIMQREVMNGIIRFLSKKRSLLTLDITGGAPELNPDFKYLVREADPFVKEILVRTNLTVLLLPEIAGLVEFCRGHKIHLISSMPCYTQENVDRQRGNGIFNKSVKALKILNNLGYGTEDSLQLDLVYNPGGAFLPGEQAILENDYKKVMKERFGIVFNTLLAITNAPIKRFETYLKANGNFNEYMSLLMDNFNKDIAGNIMCRNLLSVGWDGALYDCDFNQALGLSLKGRSGKPLNIQSLDSNSLEGNDILFEDHCYSCTAGKGSSCGGALKK